MTNADGRHYRRTQFKRLCQMVQSEYQSKGISMRTHKIERNLLEKASREFVALGHHLAEQRMLTSRAERQQLFQENYKKK